MTKEVSFEPVDGPINNRIDQAYRAKYHSSPYLSPMIGARARSATVKVIPREITARSSMHTPLVTPIAFHREPAGGCGRKRNSIPSHTPRPVGHKSKSITEKDNLYL
jgi:hypothetical protein